MMYNCGSELASEGSMLGVLCENRPFPIKMSLGISVANDDDTPCTCISCPLGREGFFQG